MIGGENYRKSATEAVKATKFITLGLIHGKPNPR